MTVFVTYDELETGGQSVNYPKWLTDIYEVREFIGRAGKLDSKEIRVGQLTLKSGANYPTHSHSAPEIYIQISGKVEWRVGKEVKTVDKLTCIDIPPYTEHSMRNLRKDKAELLYFWYAPGGDTSVLKIDAKLTA